MFNRIQQKDIFNFVHINHDIVNFRTVREQNH